MRGQARSLQSLDSRVLFDPVFEPLASHRPLDQRTGRLPVKTRRDCQSTGPETGKLHVDHLHRVRTKHRLPCKFCNLSRLPKTAFDKQASPLLARVKLRLPSGVVSRFSPRRSCRMWRHYKLTIPHTVLMQPFFRVPPVLLKARCDDRHHWKTGDITRGCRSQMCNPPVQPRLGVLFAKVWIVTENAIKIEAGFSHVGAMKYIPLEAAGRTDMAECVIDELPDRRSVVQCPEFNLHAQVHSAQGTFDTHYCVATVQRIIEYEQARTRCSDLTSSQWCGPRRVVSKNVTQLDEVAVSVQ